MKMSKKISSTSDLLSCQRLCLFQSERRLVALLKPLCAREESFYLFSFDLNMPKLPQFRYINFKNNGSIYFFEAYANEIISLNRTNAFSIALQNYEFIYFNVAAIQLILSQPSPARFSRISQVISEYKVTCCVRC